MFDYFNPYKIFKINSKIQKIVFFCFILILSIGLVEALFLSPEDYLQKDSVRIMYVHVPAAWTTLGIFSTITLLSIFGYIFKLKNFFLISKSLAPSGFIFNLIALVTGSIWGKPTWGTWWVWDARLTSALILFFIYAAIIGLHSSIDDKTKADRAISIVSLVGIAIIPIIKKSVDWWQTLHQPSTFSLTSAPSMTPDMYQPLLLCVLGFYLIFALLLTMNLRAEVVVREKNRSWVSKQFLNLER